MLSILGCLWAAYFGSCPRELILPSHKDLSKLLIFFFRHLLNGQWTTLSLMVCYADPTTFDTGYPKVTKALNNTGRPIVFSCSWPAYVVAKGLEVNSAKMIHENAWSLDHIQTEIDQSSSILSGQKRYG